jgi:hypothetical protein
MQPKLQLVALFSVVLVLVVGPLVCCPFWSGSMVVGLQKAARMIGRCST